MSDLNTSAPLHFNEKHSLGLRIWHWLFFALITSTIFIVLLASTLFRTRNNTTLVRDQLQQKGIAVNQDEARTVAHAFNDRLWYLHTWIGYFICAFLLGRFILEILQPSEEKLRHRIRNAMGLIPTSPEQRIERQHYIRVKWTYLVFYCLILIMAFTGIGLAFEGVPLFKSMHGSLKQLHSFTQYLIYGFILFHLVGVILADAGKYPGLISGMIHGKKRL